MWKGEGGRVCGGENGVLVWVHGYVEGVNFAELSLCCRRRNERPWQRRWVVFDGSELKYFRNKGDKDNLCLNTVELEKMIDVKRVLDVSVLYLFGGVCGRGGWEGVKVCVWGVWRRGGHTPVVPRGGMLAQYAPTPVLRSVISCFQKQACMILVCGY